MTATLSQPDCWFIHADGRTVACVVRDSLGYFFAWKMGEPSLIEAVIAIRSAKPLRQSTEDNT